MMKAFLVFSVCLIATTNGVSSCWYGGKDYPEGETWEVKQTGRCVRYKCSQSMIETDSVSCIDGSRKCRPIKSSGFRVIISDHTYNNCKCLADVVSGARVSCS